MEARHYIHAPCRAQCKTLTYLGILIDGEPLRLFCRSELAREKPKGSALNLTIGIIVDDFREQARSYKKGYNSTLTQLIF